MMDFESARENMLTQQCRTWGVLDNRVLEVMNHVHREDFVPEAYRLLAFSDFNLPLGHGQVMLQPKEEGIFLESLQLTSEDKVLEIGTGSGYFTALLSALAKEVHTVDIIPEFVEAADKHFSKWGISNVYFNVGDASSGWEKLAPYDVIVITGSLPELPHSFLSSLTMGGRLLAVLGTAPIMVGTLFTRTDYEQWQEKKVFDVYLPPLLSSEKESVFSF